MNNMVISHDFKIYVDPGTTLNQSDLRDTFTVYVKFRLIYNQG